MKKDEGFKSLQDIFLNRAPKVAPPAYQWQELALRIIKDLAIPDFKKSSVFKICKENSKDFVEKCLNETKELCKKGESWKYFFKVVASIKEEQLKNKINSEDNKSRV